MRFILGNALVALLIILCTTGIGAPERIPDPTHTSHTNNDEVQVENVFEVEQGIRLELVFPSHTTRLQAVTYASDRYTALILSNEVYVPGLVKQLRNHSITGYFRATPEGMELIFSKAGNHDIAFIACAQSKKLNRFSITLTYDAAVDLDKMHREAEVSHALSQTEEAIRKWQFIRSRYPLHMPTNYSLGLAYFNMGRYTESEALLERVIDLDQRSWTYPEARLFFAEARDLQDKNLSGKHITCLEEYIRFGRGDDNSKAQRYVQEAKNPIALTRLNRETYNSTARWIGKRPKAVVHFWSSACTSCAAELTALFDYAARNPAIHFIFVSLDPEETFLASSRFINKRIAPYKTAIRSQSRFINDPHQLLWQYFSKRTDLVITPPATLFLEKGTTSRYEPGPIPWRQQQAFWTLH